MSHAAPSKPEAFGWMALAAALFALMNFLVRLSSATDHWTVTAAVRASVGALVAFFIGRARGVRVFVRPSRAMWLRSLFGTVAMACSFYALTSRFIPLADTVTLNNTTPVFLALLAPWALGERGGLRVLVAVPLSMCGVLLIVRPPLVFGHATRAAHFADASALVSFDQALLPSVVAVFGAFLSSLAMISLRRASDDAAEAVAAHFSAVAFIVHGALAIVFGSVPSARAFGIMVLAGVAAGGAQVAMTRSYGLEQAARVGGLANLQVVIATALGAIALREPLSLQTAVGSLLIITAGATLTLLGIRDRRMAVVATGLEPMDNGKTHKGAQQ